MTSLAQAAFATGLHSFGPKFVAVCLLFFAFSTIIGWYFFARQNVKYLWGAKAVLPFSIIVVAFVFLGSLLKVELVWNLSDLFNGLMVIPNLIALLALSGVVAKAAAEFGKKKVYKSPGFSEWTRGKISSGSSFVSCGRLAGKLTAIALLPVLGHAKLAGVLTEIVFFLF